MSYPSTPASRNEWVSDQLDAPQCRMAVPNLTKDSATTTTGNPARRPMLCWLPSQVFFFCWRLLGLVPGGTPFSQLNKGVRDAMSATTKRDVKHQVLQKHAKGHRYQQSPNTGQRRHLLQLASSSFVSS